MDSYSRLAKNTHLGISSLLKTNFGSVYDINVVPATQLFAPAKATISPASASGIGIYLLALTLYMYCILSGLFIELLRYYCLDSSTPE